MTVRFRIRTSQGQELTFASHEMFEEFVRSGDLAPDDLVYDGETGEWAPVRTHPLILELEYEAEEAAEAETAPEGLGPDAVVHAGTTAEADAWAEGRAEATSGATDDDFGLSLAEPTPGEGMEASFGLELAPPAAGPSPEQEKQAFVERMESERATARDFGAGTESAPITGLRMEDATVLAEMVKADPEPEPEPDPPRSPSRAEAPVRVRVARPKPKGARAGKKLALLVVTLGAIGSVGYVVAGVVQPPLPVEPVDPVAVVQPEPDPEPPPPEPVIMSSEESVRDRAEERFLGATQALLEDLQPIPDVWFQGDYFLLPSDYAEVREVWEAYRTTVGRVRTDEQERYRLAYEQALDDAGVRAEEERGTRIAAATTAFAAKVDEVSAHWDRVEALAVAAIQSHDALLGAEGLLLYDPTRTTGRPDGLGAGTSGRDSDSQLLLNQVIDLMERALSSEGVGPREAANVREWTWGGFVDVITR